MYGRRAISTVQDYHHLPRLELDVKHHMPQMETHHYIQTYRHPRKHRCHHCHHNFHHNHHHSYRHDYHHPHHHHHHHHHTGRPYTYGYDDDYLSDYTCSSCDSEAARVQVYTHDTGDPWSCTCYPRASHKTIPSMMYDSVKCPHPEHLFPPAKQDYFAYPWSVQTYRPRKRLEFGYKQGQVKPPSAVTAPPFAYYTSYDENYHHRKKEHRLKGDKPPPYSAPVKPVLAPLLSGKPTDRRLRRADRRRLAAAPALTSVPEDDDISPFDSISQVNAASPARFNPDSLRLRTVDDVVRDRVQSELRYASPHHALSTPRPRPRQTVDGFPQTPTRIFKGEYVDPNNGQKYQYDIKHGRQALDGSRRLKTV